MKRILVVEDDEDIASIEKDYLEVSGYQVTVEINGTKGLTEALSGEYDLILLDIMLPGMDGFQICRKLRGKLDIPIMMVTASGRISIISGGWALAPMIISRNPSPPACWSQK